MNILLLIKLREKTVLRDWLYWVRKIVIDFNGNCLLIGIILRWGFLIWELIFIYCGLFVLILVVFCVVSSFTTFRPNFTSGLLQVIFTATSDRNDESYNRIPSNYCLETITKKFGTEPTMEDQIRIYKTKTSILDRPSSPVAQRIEALSLYGSRGALSEDSGFKSYPSRQEVYLVKNVVR